jgi:hypothetical protein
MFIAVISHLSVFDAEKVDEPHYRLISASKKKRYSRNALHRERPCFSRNPIPGA